MSLLKCWYQVSVPGGAPWWAGLSAIMVAKAEGEVRTVRSRAAEVVVCSDEGLVLVMVVLEEGMVGSCCLLDVEAMVGSCRWWELGVAGCGLGEVWAVCEAEDMVKLGVRVLGVRFVERSEGSGAGAFT